MWSGSVIALVAWAAGCAAPVDSNPWTDPTPQTWTNSAQELDVLEAVFRYQLAHNGSSAAAKGHVGYYFLSHGQPGQQEDPSTVLMARFSDHTPPVAPVSDADASARRVQHKEHGGRGVLLNIDRIRRVNDRTMDVDGGYFENGLSASGNTYRVVQRGREWVVVSVSEWWIS